MTEPSHPDDPASIVNGRVVPVLFGIGLVIAGLLYLLTVSPRIAFGISLVILGGLLTNHYA